MDRERGVPPSEFGQIPFFQWLSHVSREEIAVFASHSQQLGLDDFEVRNLEDLPWFQALSLAFASPEHLPDCFHLWTARRNGMDVLLTLEKKLPRIVEQLKRRKQGAIDSGVAVLRPTELLRQLNVTELDAVPIEPGQFYSYREIIELRDRLLKGQLGSMLLSQPRSPLSPSEPSRGSAVDLQRKTTEKLAR